MGCVGPKVNESSNTTKTDIKGFQQNPKRKIQISQTQKKSKRKGNSDQAQIKDNKILQNVQNNEETNTNTPKKVNKQQIATPVKSQFNVAKQINVIQQKSTVSPNQKGKSPQKSCVYPKMVDRLPSMFCQSQIQLGSQIPIPQPSTLNLKWNNNKQQIKTSNKFALNIITQKNIRS